MSPSAATDPALLRSLVIQTTGNILLEDRYIFLFFFFSIVADISSVYQIYSQIAVFVCP